MTVSNETAENLIRKAYRTCKWTYHEGDNRWDTECGQVHQFTFDGPEENRHRYCPYCGGRLEVSDE